MRDASTFTFFVPPRATAAKPRVKNSQKGKGKPGTWRSPSLPPSTLVSPFRTVCEIFKAMHSFFSSLLSSSCSPHSLICPRSLDFFFCCSLSFVFQSLLNVFLNDLSCFIFTQFYQQQWLGRMFNPLDDFVSKFKKKNTLYFNFEKSVQVLSNLFNVRFFCSSF